MKSLLYHGSIASGWSEICRVGFLSTLPLESCAFLTAHFNSLLGPCIRMLNYFISSYKL